MLISKVERYLSTVEAQAAADRQAKIFEQEKRLYIAKDRFFRELQDFEISKADFDAYLKDRNCFLLEGTTERRYLFGIMYKGSFFEIETAIYNAETILKYFAEWLRQKSQKK